MVFIFGSIAQPGANKTKHHQKRQHCQFFQQQPAFVLIVALEFRFEIVIAHRIPTFPDFSVLSHFDSAPFNSRMYDAKLTAHNSAPYPLT